jgi:hypothetical protein
MKAAAAHMHVGMASGMFLTAMASSLINLPMQWLEPGVGLDLSPRLQQLAL